MRPPCLGTTRNAISGATPRADIAVRRGLWQRLWHGDAVRATVCLHHEDWHPGVVGLVASKMKDRLHRPVIAFAPSEPGADTL